jgi:hypothetical protein
LRDELGIIAVEGKVEESFADLVSDWNTTPGKQRRLENLCDSLDLPLTQVGLVRYQLLHRTASAIYEAKRYRARHALMLVHSLSRTHRWFEDFAAFSCAMAQPSQRPGVCSAAKTSAAFSALCFLASLLASEFNEVNWRSKPQQVTLKSVCGYGTFSGGVG